MTKPLLTLSVPILLTVAALIYSLVCRYFNKKQDKKAEQIRIERVRLGLEDAKDEEEEKIIHGFYASEYTDFDEES